MEADRATNEPTVLSLLGAFDLRHGDTAIELSRPAQRVLALLALSPMPREQSAQLLWPDVDLAHALGRYRTATWRLRRGTVPLLNRGTQHVRLDRRVLVDVDQLTAWARRPDETGDWLSPSRRWDLLADWDDDWLVSERERLRQLRLHGLEQLTTALIARGRFGAALQAALACVADDPLRESGHRSVIEVHLAEGNRTEAIRAFDRYRSVLRREMGLEPSLRIRQLVAYAVPTGFASWRGPLPATQKRRAAL